MYVFNGINKNSYIVIILPFVKNKKLMKFEFKDFFEKKKRNSVKL